LCAFFTKIQAQNIQPITGSTTVDPQKSTPYAVFTDVDNDTSFKLTFAWTLVNPTNKGAIQGNTNRTCNVTFTNELPNVRGLRVTVTFLKNGATTTQTADFIPFIFVKVLIGPTQMTVSGSTIPTETFTNNSTVSFPCNSIPVDLLLGTPTTGDGQTVNYEWTTPLFNTTSHNGNSTSLTGNFINPSNTSNGTITIIARRIDNDGFSQTYKLNYTRPVVGAPTINFTYGSPATCAGETRLMTGSSTNASTFGWTPISTGTIFTLNAATGMVKFNSTTTLTLTVSNSCGQPKTVSKVIEVGPPIVTPTVNWDPLSYPNYIQNPGFLKLTSNTSGWTYNYQVINGTGNIYGSGDPSQVYVYAYPFVRIEGTATNRCGSTSNTFISKMVHHITEWHQQTQRKVSFLLSWIKNRRKKRWFP
jgi:hypothetical protein